MPITLGLNLSSLKAQTQLSRTSDELSNVFTRLSSGQRINKASDDAAGLAIADSLNADSRVFNQGVRNLNDGISVLNIADGALQELTNITFRLTELAEQAANGTLGVHQRASLDEEAQALKAEYFRISKTTEFNGRKIFDGDYGVLSLQAGYGSDAILGDGLGGAIGDGTFESGETVASSVFTTTNPDSLVSADFNGDGKLDVVTLAGPDRVELFFGNGSGGFSSGQSIGTHNTSSISVGDFNGDGSFDVVFGSGVSELSIVLNNGDGTFTSATTFSSTHTLNQIDTIDVNNDGHLDFVGASNNNGFEVFLGSGSGTFSSSQVVASTDVREVTLGDINNDGTIDIVAADTLNIDYYLGNGDGTFSGSSTSISADPYWNIGVSLTDVNGDGNLDVVALDGGSALLVYTGNGDATFQQNSYAVSYGLTSEFDYGDLNGDGEVDFAISDIATTDIKVLLSDGQGGYESAVSHNSNTVSIGQIEVEDFSNDGVLDILVHGTSLGYLEGKSVDGVAPLLDFSLGNVADARQALSLFQQKLNQLSEQRGQIGAFQSRIEVAEKVLKVSTENFKAAESRIRDADIAQESSQLTRLNILQQSAAAVLGQANLQPQLVLQLLGGGR